MKKPRQRLSPEARRLNGAICRYEEAKQDYRAATVDMRVAVGEYIRAKTPEWGDQVKLAKKIKIFSAVQIANIKRGTIILSAEKMRRLLRALGEYHKPEFY